MVNKMEYAFYFFAVLCGYSYFFYPLILRFVPVRSMPKADASGAVHMPRLSLIITAHNEEGRIREKLDNTLLINYPQEYLEIIVASDCSTDNTDDIVESYAGKGVRLVRAEERNGKEYAQ